MDCRLPRYGLLFLLVAVGPLPVGADEILFIGNSFTFGASSPAVQNHGGVPGLVEAIARAQGRRVATFAVTVKGADWSHHLADPATEKVLRAKKWTWVVLQDVSTRPTHIGNVRKFMQDGKTFSEKIAINSPATGILLYETWVPQRGGFYQCAPGNSFSGPGQMMDEVHRSYAHLRADLAAQNKSREVRVAQVGTAFARVAAQCPAIRLEASDHHHATTEGYYLAALVIDETIYGESVKGAPTSLFPGDLTIPADDATNLQKVADEVARPGMNRTWPRQMRFDQTLKKQLLFSLIFLFLGPSVYAQMAQGKAKFLGNVLRSPQADPNFATYWNQATPESGGKWGSVEPTRGLMDWSGFDAMYHYAQSHGFVFEQHNFIWDQQQPSWMDSLPPDQQKLETTKWISQYGQRYPDTQLIDVVSEPLHHPPHYKKALGGDGSTGWDWVIWAFSTARQYCPHSKLLLNESNILAGGKDLEQFIAIIKILKQRNLIDGIAVKGHGLENVSDTTIYFSLNRLGNLELPIYISALDLDIANDDSQQKRYKSLFPILWEHSAVRGVTLWGYKEHHTWKPDTYTYLLRADGSERPALVWLKEYMSH